MIEISNGLGWVLDVTATMLLVYIGIQVVRIANRSKQEEEK